VPRVGCLDPQSPLARGNAMKVQRQFIDITSTKVLVELPQSFVNHRVELIVLAVDEERAPIKKRRRPHPEIAGNGTTIGNFVQPIAHESN
jgi:hypothetical protein